MSRPSAPRSANGMAFTTATTRIYAWWNAEPYKAVDTALQSYSTLPSRPTRGLDRRRMIRATAPEAEGVEAAREVAGVAEAPGGGGEGGWRGWSWRRWRSRRRPRLPPAVLDRDAEIIGNPIGREALLNELAYEMIPYSPEELVEIAEQASSPGARPR